MHDSLSVAKLINGYILKGNALDMFRLSVKATSE
uniref:Uncharacterized protein n=1 Tax=Arundo donax TaxID=35708 RepID=A0A0A9FX58_ARUDO